MTTASATPVVPVDPTRTASLPLPADVVSRSVALMGGRVGVHLSPPCDTADVRAGGVTAAADADHLLRLMSTWADRLTRFSAVSALSRLNADPRTEVPVGPTLAAVLDWGRHAEGLTGGIVDVGLLDARLAAEGLLPADDWPKVVDLDRASAASRSWSLDRQARGAVVRRPAGLRFDLDGIGKGWLADRALGRLTAYPCAVVDADGDIAIRLGPGTTWSFGVADPRLDGSDLAVLDLTVRGEFVDSADGRFGLATSGTSVHRWGGGTRPSHHLIDPRTRRPADTDVVQATVLARTAREAEVLAKAAVILGSTAANEFLDRVGVDGAMLLTVHGELLVHPATMRWLA